MTAPSMIGSVAVGATAQRRVRSFMSLLLMTSFLLLSTLLLTTTLLVGTVEARGGWGSAYRVQQLQGRLNKQPGTSNDNAFVPINTNTLMRQDLQSRQQAAPRYDIEESEDGVSRLSLDVGNVNVQDLKVEIDDAGRVISVMGKRNVAGVAATEDRMTSFDHSFRLDNAVDEESLRVTLAHGLLTISATRKKMTNEPVMCE